MAAQGTVIALTTTATSIAGNALHGVLRVTVRPGSASVYLGGSDVTTAGYLLSTGDAPLTVTLQVGEQLFGTSTGSIPVSVLRVGETT
jgi:hypothetical protein